MKMWKLKAFQLISSLFMIGEQILRKSLATLQYDEKFPHQKFQLKLFAYSAFEIKAF